MQLFLPRGLISAVVIKDYLIFPPASPDSTRAARTAVTVNTDSNSLSNQIQRGTKLTFSGIDWEKNGQTLIIALSDKCHFCSESAPFYQRLTREHGRAHLVAVLPQSVEDGRKYLESLGVNIDDVRQVSFPSMGLRGTPTLILADDKGVAVDSWLGRLPAEREGDVLSRMR